MMGPVLETIVSVVIFGIGGVMAILAIFDPISKAVGIFVAVIYGLVYVLGLLYDMFHKTGSPMLYEMPRYFAEGFALLGEALMFPITMILKLISSLGKLYTAYKQGGSILGGLLGLEGDTVEATNSTMVDKLSKIDTEKLSAGLAKVKTNLSEISNISGRGGFLTMKADGPNTEVMMASDNVMAQAFGGRLAVDVNIPKQAAPQTTVKVYIDGEAVQSAVARVIEEAG